jgi:hypothetical protein
LKAEALYHSGIVVDDFDATLDWFSQTAGYRWCEPYAGDQVVVTPDGEITVPMRITYSTTEPRLEILQSAPGTLWMPSDSGVHHLGYWSDDVCADMAMLQARGLDVEAQAPLPDGSLLWVYCKAPTGPRIELVSRVMEPALTEWFTRPR